MILTTPKIIYDFSKQKVYPDMMVWLSGFRTVTKPDIDIEHGKCGYCKKGSYYGRDESVSWSCSELDNLKPDADWVDQWGDTIPCPYYVPDIDFCPYHLEEYTGECYGCLDEQLAFDRENERLIKEGFLKGV